MSDVSIDLPSGLILSRAAVSGTRRTQTNIFSWIYLTARGVERENKVSGQIWEKDYT